MFPLYLQYLLIDLRPTFVTGTSWDTDDLITFLGQKVKVQGHTIAAEAHSTRRYRRVQLFLVIIIIVSPLTDGGKGGICCEIVGVCVVRCCRPLPVSCCCLSGFICCEVYDTIGRLQSSTISMVMPLSTLSSLLSVSMLCFRFVILLIQLRLLLSPPSERSEWRRYCFRSICVCLSVCLCAADRSVRPV